MLKFCNKLLFLTNRCKPGTEDACWTGHFSVHGQEKAPSQLAYAALSLKQKAHPQITRGIE